MTSKIKVGIYTFTCCEDSTIMITVLMSKYFFEWKKRIDFVDARVLRKSGYDGPLDVALVEGAITAQEQVEKLKKIRERAKKLITIGSCACTGTPSALRNDFDPARKKEIEFILERFKYAEKVHKIADIVPVDGQVVGCPMDTNTFLKALNDIFVEFGHEPINIED